MRKHCGPREGIKRLDNAEKGGRARARVCDARRKKKESD